MSSLKPTLRLLRLAKRCRKINVPRLVSGGIRIGDIRTQQVHSLSTKRQYLRRDSQCFVYCCHGLFPCHLSLSYIQKPCQLNKYFKNSYLKEEISRGKVLTPAAIERVRTKGTHRTDESPTQPHRNLSAPNTAPSCLTPQRS